VLSLTAWCATCRCLRDSRPAAIAWPSEGLLWGCRLLPCLSCDGTFSVMCVCIMALSSYADGESVGKSMARSCRL
jgi:hypothetical protein